MHTVSDLYRSIYSGRHRKEVIARIAGEDYSAEALVSVKVSNALFSGNNPVIGSCV